MAKTTEYNLSKKIINLLESKGHSLEEISKAAELSKSSICRIKKGERSLTLSRLKTIASNLKVPIPVLLWGAINSLPYPQELEQQHQDLKAALDKSKSIRKMLDCL
ncbi:MAG: helix-turn-helix transcriptional regulator [Sedimentisphaerales bacterium]|nr:helix-turn-helix transcriptional regulator [Sedimentisphaerales bacterium]